MILKFELYFEKENKFNEIEKWVIKFEPNDGTFIEQFKELMTVNSMYLANAVNHKRHKRFLKLVMKDNQDIIKVIKSIELLADNSHIHLEYLSKFNWKIIHNATLSKIITTNFPELLFKINQVERNLISNLAKNYLNNINDQENQKNIEFFKIEKIELSEKFDSHKIKTLVYKTPVKYRKS